MSIIGSNILAGASGNQGYNLNNSLRFRGSASAYLRRTPGVAGSLRTWTASFWYKNGNLSTNETLFSNAVESDSIGFRSGRKIEIYFGAGTANLVTTQVFRDVAAWYHIVVAVDTTQATSSNRIKLYVNGSQVTAFSTATYPTQNYETSFNRDGFEQEIGRRASGTDYPLDGYMAEINWIDGSAKTPSDFGETSATTGSWIPKKYAGTYGTNGYYLKFSDIATTSGSNAGLGKDFSGNGNYFNTYNISVTAGVTYDAMLDVPTNTSATVANYCTLNPLSTTSTLANGNLTYSSGATYCQGTQFPTSGLFYAEVVASGTFGTQGISWGVIGATANMATTAQPGVASPTGAYSVYSGGGLLAVWSNTGYTNETNPFTVGQTWQIALDVTTGYMYLGQNNTWYSPTMAATGNPSTGANPTFTLSNLSTSGGFSVLCGNNTAGGTFAWNFGQRPFTYTPPTGFVALNTYNLPTPTILQGNKYMDAVLWTGDGTASKAVTGVNFAPDFLWGKNRSTASIGWWLYDSIRGAGNTKELGTHQDLAEGGDNEETYGYLSSFDSAGFTGVNGAGSPNYYFNQSSATYVAFALKANGATTITNTSGTISSNVSVNTTAGFSVVTYTGTGANATVGHGLGVAPKMIIFKGRSTTFDWMVYHTSLGNTNYLRLNQTNASAASSSAFNNTSPTSTVFSLGDGSLGNQSSATQVAYCWAEIAGFSKFDSYTGNGSADGPFIFTGFRPKFILIKQSSSAGNAWQLLDSARNTYNKADKALFPNTTGVETTGNATFDFLSNGFKVRTTDGTVNTSSSTYIYAAFAENPFKVSNAR